MRLGSVTFGALLVVLAMTSTLAVSCRDRAEDTLE